MFTGLLNKTMQTSPSVFVYVLTIYFISQTDCFLNNSMDYECSKAYCTVVLIKVQDMGFIFAGLFYFSL